MAEALGPLKLEGVPFITLDVGPDKIVFHVHQNLLCNASTVFNTAFSGNFQEASERSMSLPDHDKDSVGRMISWLYTKNLELTKPVSNETSEECYMQLAKLNTLADKYDMYLLKNHIVDELFDLTKPPRGHKPPQAPVIAYVYNNTTEGSTFRKLMVAWYAYRIDPIWYERDATKDDLAEVSQDFSIDLVMALGARTKHPQRKSLFIQPSSTYHEKPPKKTDGDHA